MKNYLRYNPIYVVLLGGGVALTFEVLEHFIFQSHFLFFHIIVWVLFIIVYLYIRMEFNTIFKEKNNLLETLEEKVLNRTYLLEKSTQKVNNILNKMQEGYFECDLTGTMTRANDKLGDIFGYSNSMGCIGKNFSDHVSPETYNILVNSIVEQIKSRGESLPLKPREFDIKDTNGKVKTIELYSDVVKDDIGNIIGFRGFIRDISKRNETLRQLKGNMALLEEWGQNLLTHQTQTIRDLRLAKSLQDKLLPPSPDLKGWDIGIHFQPMSDISGDFYDIYLGRNKNLRGIGIYDVSGHGISSGLLSLVSKHIIQEEFRKSLSNIISLEDMIYSIDKTISKEFKESGYYLTGLILQIIDNNSFNYISAGHPSMIKVSGGKVETQPIEDNGVMLGFDLYSKSGINFSAKNITLQKDEYVVLFSDGLIEARKDNKCFCTILNEVLENIPHNLQSQEIIQKIVSELYGFVGSENLDDDLTIIVLKKN